MVENVEREAIAEEPARARQWARNIDGRLDYSYVRSPPSTWGSSHEESNREHSESGSVREAQSSDLDEVETPGERAGLEASNWIDAHMKGIGLLPEERLKLFDDMHPALSDYAPASDIPSQLGTGRRPRSMHSGSESGRWPQLNTNRPVSVAGPPTSVVDESIWEPASVVSFSQSGSHVPRDSETVVAAPSTVSTVTSLAPDLNGRRNAPSLVSLPPDHGPYLAFCREMGLKVDPEILRQQQASSDEAGGDSPPPPSSIYSQD
ncbi:hypothetical protein N0V84_000012 [Fusarium piperis]|uniref:Uncharacterized protein n=1 Tax=Fusarium piperis TaxID=1435070 RepID=A0A9W8WNB5_9HYPO|nr:hypothetical protein N0V84_000012 [Fusarium piperis]